MKERILAQRQKNNTAPISIPTLKQPKRGFGSQSSDSSQALTQLQRQSQPLAHDISRISLRPQAKLTVSQPNDMYEQEADRVAQQVMHNMSQPANQQSIQREAMPEDEEQLQAKSLANSITPLVQREEIPEEEEQLQAKSLTNSITSLQREEIPEEEEEQLQAKSLTNSITSLQREEIPEEDEELQAKSSGSGIETSSHLESSIQQARGSGQNLGDDVRQPMEQAFGYDFSSVKIHNDFNSDQMNKSIQARAFTTGQDIFFRQGEYKPESNSGKELLAHELTHVVQQNH
ncbi:DUF4157 domain-containing protein [Tolypothrix sp. FACHB-123]|uniref:eCIS core domain-containing protein n=1 Tax=Tolypothrix sp. FACHB-123 TaxID=2692868 RepID=UPI0016863717|nr:DUF4157 domain-containing protein [Tolypothrix sp. FACHB-123]MBD2359087.1 DUF4157 domain-containing protein [Tolypothrix sp. FACHB-123]